jgi:hypothetical protein
MTTRRAATRRATQSRLPRHAAHARGRRPHLARRHGRASARAAPSARCPWLHAAERRGTRASGAAGRQQRRGPARAHRCLCCGTCSFAGVRTFAGVSSHALGPIVDDGFPVDSTMALATAARPAAGRRDLGECVARTPLRVREHLFFNGTALHFTLSHMQRRLTVLTAGAAGGSGSCADDRKEQSCGPAGAAAPPPPRRRRHPQERRGRLSRPRRALRPVQLRPPSGRPCACAAADNRRAERQRAAEAGTLAGQQLCADAECRARFSLPARRHAPRRPRRPRRQPVGGPRRAGGC